MGKGDKKTRKGKLSWALMVKRDLETLGKGKSIPNLKKKNRQCRFN